VPVPAEEPRCGYGDVVLLRYRYRDGTMQAALPLRVVHDDASSLAGTDDRRADMSQPEPPSGVSPATRQPLERPSVEIGSGAWAPEGRPPSRGPARPSAAPGRRGGAHATPLADGHGEVSAPRARPPSWPGSGRAVLAKDVEEVGRSDWVNRRHCTFRISIAAISETPRRARTTWRAAGGSCAEWRPCPTPRSDDRAPARVPRGPLAAHA
jgi:hypothetical protein